VDAAGRPDARSSEPLTAIDRAKRLKWEREQQDAPAQRLNVAKREIAKLKDDDELSDWLKDPVFLAREFRVDTQPKIEAWLTVFARELDDDERYASLAVAATREDHLDVWLAAAEGLPTASGEPAEGARPIDPLSLPHALFPEPVRTRVALGLLRRGDDPARAVPGPLWDYQVPQDLRHVFAYLRSAPKGRDTAEGRAADLEFLLGLRSHEAAATALRAGVGRSLSIRELAPAEPQYPNGRLSPAGWAALASRPLEAASVRLLKDEPAHWMRRAVGFHEKPAEPDGDNLRFAEGLRRALFTPHPPLAASV
jgi:hypothetical protein